MWPDNMWMVDLAEDNIPTLNLMLTKIERVAAGTNLFTFSDPTVATLPPAEAGAHIGIRLPGDIERQYSIVHPAAAPSHYTVGIKHDEASRGGSRYLHEDARVGSTFVIDPPRNNFPLYRDAPHSVLIAGGIGITPIYAMIEELRATGGSWEMVHACRSRADAAFYDPLHGADNVRYHFDEEAGGRHLDIAGIITGARPDAHFYCCGPAPMLAAFEAAASAAGIAPLQVHVEYFTQKYEVARKGGFIVELARSGVEIVVEPGQSILQAVQSIGIEVPYSCEEGICGSCETAVVSGEPDHRDAILTDAERAENKTMMICCSGCKGARLVLDL